jgi:hypothetical protein
VAEGVDRIGRRHRQLDGLVHAQVDDRHLHPIGVAAPEQCDLEAVAGPAGQLAREEL